MPLKGGEEPPAEYKATFLDWETLEERGAPPEREWAVDHWLGMGHITLLAAKGGMGKSIFSQQLGTALALKRDFVSAIAEPRQVLAWMGEDDDDELWRRQTAICKKFDTPLGFLRGRLHVESMVDTDCTLVARVMGVGMVRTGMLKELREQVGDLKAEIVVLDNVAKLFSGDENNRSDVTAFLTAINWASAPTKAGALLVGHPSKVPNAEYSGSTAWENACRARWWLTDHPPDKKPDQDDPDDPITDLRYLAKRKVNYTARDLCVLKYEQGAYTVVSAAANPTGMVAAIRADVAARIFMAALTQLSARGIYGNDSTNSPAYLPKVILQYGLAENMTKFELANAMRQLILGEKIARGVVGQYQNRTPKYGIVIKE